MITSLKEMLELPNLTRFIIEFESRDKILLVMSCTEIMTS